MKTIAVIGISGFGMHLCKFLSKQGVQVLAMDINEERVDLVKPYVHRAVICDATRRMSLVDHELELFDGVVVSLGERIDTSVLVTLYLKQLGVKMIVAKATSPDHEEILMNIGATRVVSPEKEMARTLAHQLGSRNLLQYVQLDAEYSVIELPPPAAWLGKSMGEIQVRRNWSVQVLLIHHHTDPGKTIIPDGDHRFTTDDRLVVIGREPALNRLKAAT